MKAPTTLAKLLLIAVVTGAATTGCATGGISPSRGVARHEQAAVSIRNDSWIDVRVYLVPASGSSPVRIGKVGSLSTERFPLRGRIRTELLTQGSLRFLIEPFASFSESYTTPTVFMSPGNEMLLTVANQVWLSTIVVRDP